MSHLPAINLVQYNFALSFPVLLQEIRSYPVYQMILEGAFDELVQKIRRRHFVDVCTREFCGEWLCRRGKKRLRRPLSAMTDSNIDTTLSSHHDSVIDAILIPKFHGTQKTLQCII